MGHLMRLAWLEDECVSGFNRGRPSGVTDNALAGNHMVKLPLRAMRVIRVGSLSGSDAANLNIKRMPLPEIRGQRVASQGLRNLPAGAGKLSFWRRPELLGNILCVYFAHTLFA